MIAPHVLLRMRLNRAQLEVATPGTPASEALLEEYRALAREAREGTSREDLAETARAAIRPGRDGRRDRDLYNFACEVYHVGTVALS